MSNRTCLRGARRYGVALAVGFASLAVPVSAQSAEVDLGTAHPFRALGATAVTNTGPSVLNGDLGVFQPAGGALSGFRVVDGGPGIVNGAVHDDDVVAQSAQSDLTTAYNVAAGEPSSGSLTGQDLGNRTLTPGTYTSSSSAQLTGPLTLDAQGDPAARFIFQIGTTLTTAPNASVVLTNGASPCNVYWQVGSSATLDTDTVFVGTIMANASITVNTRTTVLGRALARTGAVTLDNNTFTDPGCARGGTTTQGTPGTPATSGTPGTPAPVAAAPAPAPAPAANADQPPPGSRTTVRTRKGTSTLRRTTRLASGRKCTDGFTARVRGRLIKSVVFRLDGKRVSTRRRSPFQVYVKAAAGKHKVTARVSYKDATRAKTMTLAYRGCASAALRPRRGPSQFTG